MIYERLDILNRIRDGIERSPIIVLDGLHRSGKSRTLTAAVKGLRASTPPVHVIHLKSGHGIADHRELAAAARGLGVGPSALCLDDADRIPGYAEALCEILERHNTRIITTGERTVALFEELENRFGSEAVTRVAIPPLSYPEWLAAGNLRDSAGALQRYARSGGLPDSGLFPEEDPKTRELLEMRVNAFLFTQIVENQAIRNPAAIRPILTLLASHMGEMLSARQIRDALEGSKYSLSPQSVIDYLEACRLSGLIVSVPVYDLSADRELQSAQVWYFGDNGLRAAFAGKDNAGESDRALRNLLFLSLTGAGWKVRQGRLDAARERKEEISFICEVRGKRLYVQSVGNAATAGERVRKYQALLSIRDGWPKLLIDPTGPSEGAELTADGVRHFLARDFLREPVIP